MTKREKFEIEVRSIAKQMIELQKQFPDENVTYTRYIMDDLTERTEKTFLNELTKKLEREIKVDKSLNMPSEIHEAMLKVAKSRLKTIIK